MRRSSVLVVLAALVVSGALIAVIAGASGDGDGPVTATTAPGEGCVAAAGGRSRSRAILECVGPSLAFVDTPLGTGSGILVEGDYVVTNAHVVEPFAAVDLVFGPAEHHAGVPVEAVDFYADLAIVGPVRTGRRPLAIADYDRLQRGEDVYLVGYPGEVDDEPEATISRGILSRVRRARGYGLSYLQTDASIGGGQSGGALVDDEGRVVGVSGFSFAEQFALALSGRDTRRSISAMRAGEAPPYQPFPEHGASEGTFLLGDPEAAQVLTRHTGEQAETVRLTLPPEVQPAVFATDLAGEEVFFRNRESVDAALDAGDETPVSDDEIGSPTAPGVFEFEVPPSTYALIMVGTRLPGGASVSYSSSVPLGRYDDADDHRPLALGERVTGALSALEVNGDTYLVELQAGQEVDVFAGSPTGDVEFEVRAPGQKGRDADFVDDSGLGLFGADAQDTYEARTAGVHRITVYSADGAGLGYVLEVRPA